MKLDLIRKHGKLVIRHWIFWKSPDAGGLSEPVQMLSCVFFW